MQNPPPFSAFFHPRYWPTWAGMMLLLIVARLPFFLRLKTGELLGMLTYRFARERRYITTVNIGICFPELDRREQRQLVKRSFRENGIGLVETVTGWVRNAGSFKSRTRVTGLDELEAASRQGRGVLLIGAHYSTLDLAGTLVSNFHAFAATYRPHNNPLFNAFMVRGRLSNAYGLIDRNDIRGALRHLKNGNTLWYAPDQDYGPEHAVYAPFFGKPAATITAASRIAAFNRSPTFLIRHHRSGRRNRYEVEFIPFPDSFPGNDDVRDATLINAMIERAVRHYPAQYLWMHKRFKTQPGGKPESPYIDIRTPTKRLTEQQYRHMLEGARQVSSGPDDTADYLLASGLRLRRYPGLVGKHFFQRHPAGIFDSHAKNLRMGGFRCITVDNFFRVETLQISAATYFAAPGGPLCPPWPVASLAGFMADLHDRGFTWRQPSPTHLSWDGTTLAIADPTTFDSMGHLALADRQRDLKALAAALALDETATDTLFARYADATGVQAREPGRA